MAYSKISLLDKAVDITKAYATGGGKNPLDAVLEEIYLKLSQLNQDADKDQ